MKLLRAVEERKKLISLMKLLRAVEERKKLISLIVESPIIRIIFEVPVTPNLLVIGEEQQLRSSFVR
jgi:hypothetical protein